MCGHISCLLIDNTTEHKAKLPSNLHTRVPDLHLPTGNFIRCHKAMKDCFYSFRFFKTNVNSLSWIVYLISMYSVSQPCVLKVTHNVIYYRAAVLNEDEEDSAESSTDEEAEVTTYVANEVEYVTFSVTF